MKAIILSAILGMLTASSAQDIGTLFQLPSTDDISVTNLEPNPSINCIAKQTIFAQEVAKGLARINIGDATIQVVIRKTNDQTSPVMTFEMPKLMSRRPSYAIHVIPSFLEKNAIAFEHVVLHELMHIKRGDVGTSRFPTEDLPDDEKERQIEYLVYKLVGWERYQAYWEDIYENDVNLKETWQKELYMDMVQRYLGIYQGP